MIKASRIAAWTFAMLGSSVALDEQVRAADARFSTGVQLQKEALATSDTAARRAALDKAETIFAQQLEQGAQQGAALNNLAVIAVNKGDSAAAQRYFDRALATDDPNKGVFALNYSKFLEATDKPAAIRLARTAVAAAPDSIAANTQLGRLLWQTNPAEMLPLAGALMQRGHTELATQFAMQSLASQSRPATERAAWLILIASRVAREYGISDDARAALLADLATLAQDSEIGRGSQQLHAVMLEPPIDAAGVDWWRDQYQPPAGQSQSGRDAIRAVLIAAGEYQTAKDAARAEHYFTSAIPLGNRGPDPDAFLRLVELYAGNHETAKLTKLMGSYQYEMFTEKGDAYARQDWPLVYRMHVALGMTYARLQIWQSQEPYQNAIFQLTHAMSAADRINRAAEKKGWEHIALPPVAIEELARGYAAIGSPNIATKARIDGAEALRSIGHLPDSKTVFLTIPADALTNVDESSRATYQKLRMSLEL